MDRKIQVPEPQEGIGKLSTELIIEIFTFLSPQDRLACSLVSKRWYALARTRKFHGTIQISSPNDKETIPALFKGRIFPFKKIIFRNVSFLWQKEWAAFWTIVKPHIGEIQFAARDPPAFDLQVFEMVLPELPQLEKLTLLEQYRDINLPNSSVDSVVLKSLRVLDVNIGKLPNALLVYLVNRCPALELLKVSDQTFGSSPQSEVLKTLTSLCGVPKIKYRHCNTSDCKQQMFLLLNICYATIAIYKTSILSHFASYAANQSHLECLYFSQVSLDPMDKPTVDFLTSMNCIEEIYLSGCTINLNTFMSLSSQVKGLKTLVLYHVDFVGISKTSKYTFAELESLEILWYDDVEIDDEAIDAMKKMRLACPKLRFLEMPHFDLGFACAFPLLQKLTIDHMFEISLSDFCALRSLERLTHLTIYDLSKLASCDWELFVFKALKCFVIRKASLKVKVTSSSVIQPLRKYVLRPQFWEILQRKRLKLHLSRNGASVGSVNRSSVLS